VVECKREGEVMEGEYVKVRGTPSSPPQAVKMAVHELSGCRAGVEAGISPHVHRLTGVPTLTRAR
jgi:hypothetical protein